MKTTNKHIHFFIIASMLYICLIQLIHAIIYTPQALKGQSTGNITLFIDILFYIILCIPMIVFVFNLLKNNRLKTMPSLFSIIIKENWMIIIPYFLLLYIIQKNCFSGDYLIELFGKQMIVPKNQSYFLVFFYYLFDEYITLFTLGITPFIGYLALRNRHQ